MKVLTRLPVLDEYADADRCAVMLGNDVKWWKKGNEVAREMLQAYFGETGASARHRIRTEPTH